MAICALALLFITKNLSASVNDTGTSTDSLQYLFKRGDDGYACYRIPAIITTKKGTVLAFAEARKANCGDSGDIDLVLKRSENNGKTWSKMQVVWSDLTNTCGNPAPVEDRITGKIFLLSTWNLGKDHEKEIIADTSKNTRRVYFLSSINDGKTWSKSTEITKNVKPDNWSWYATGPCHGIQLTEGNKAGRLVFSGNHIVKGGHDNFSHAIYSDDHGTSWHLAGTTTTEGGNESTIAERSTGELILNMRNADRKKRYRQVAASFDGGKTWSVNKPDKALPEPICQANLLRYNYLKGDKKVFLFSNPADTAKRQNHTIRLSNDDARTWPFALLVHKGPSAYSDLTVLANKRILSYFEAGYKTPYDGIAWKVFRLKDLKKPVVK